MRSALPFLLALGLMPFASACLSHERGDDAGTPADARTASDAFAAADAPAPDGAVIAPDAATRPDAFVAECSPDPRWVTVRVEPITADASRCDVFHVEGADLRGAEPEPGEDGIRLHFDFCPTADGDCRCDVVVGRVGVDVAAELAPLYPVDVDLSPGEDPMSMPHLSVRKSPTCACDACGCSLPLYFYAASAFPRGAPALPPGLAFDEGPALCPAESCTYGGSMRLHALTDAGEADLGGGETIALGATLVRSVRDVEILAPCAACAGCSSPYGAFVAWAAGTDELGP